MRRDELMSARLLSEIVLSYGGVMIFVPLLLILVVALTGAAVPH
jgi:hypothetical protein